MAKAAKLKVVPKAAPTKLDIGCGKNKREGFTGVDQYEMDNVDIVCDLRKPWPFEDDSIEEIYCSHFIEHLESKDRVHFYNELYRVMKKDAKATVIVPHWCSNRAYGDPTHAWPPVSEMSFYYLSQVWRKTQAPHTDSFYNKDGFKCDFEATWGYSMHPTIMTRNQEFQQFAIGFYKEAAQDMIATLTKR